MYREVLPERRASWTHSAKVGGQRVFLDVGFYPDGRIGEVFIDVAKAGTAVKGFCQALAITLSVAIQYGVPVAALAEAIRGTDFLPRGMVEGSHKIEWASSIVDYVAQELLGLSEPKTIDLTTKGRGV